MYDEVPFARPASPWSRSPVIESLYFVKTKVPFAFNLWLAPAHVLLLSWSMTPLLVTTAWLFSWFVTVVAVVPIDCYIYFIKWPFASGELLFFTVYPAYFSFSEGSLVTLDVVATAATILLFLVRFRVVMPCCGTGSTKSSFLALIFSSSCSNTYYDSLLWFVKPFDGGRSLFNGASGGSVHLLTLTDLGSKNSILTSYARCFPEIGGVFSCCGS